MARLWALLLALLCVACCGRRGCSQGALSDAANSFGSGRAALAFGAAGGRRGASLSAALLDGGVPAGARLHATSANASELAFLSNWARHARVGRIPHLVLLALDADAAAAGARLGLITLECAHAGFASLRPLLNLTPPRASSVPKLTASVLPGRAAVVAVLQAALSQGYDVLLSEPDVVWLRNPELYLAVYDMAAADVLVASDCLFHFTARPVRDPRTGVSREPLAAPLSLSLLAVRATQPGQAFVAAWAAALSAQAPAGEDGATRLARTFAEVLALDGGKAAPQRVTSLAPIPGGSWEAAAREDLFPRYPPRVNDGTQAMPYRACNGSLGLGVLPVGLFTSGHTHFAADLPVRYRLKPYTLHAGTTLARQPEAVAALREAGLWGGEEKAGYWSPQGGLLALELRLPEPLLAATRNASAPAGLRAAHGELMRWQLARLAEGFAVAQATGRALLLPPLRCACDDGGVDGACLSGEAPQRTPFACPLGAGVRVGGLEALGWAYRAAGHAAHPRFAELQLPPSARMSLRLCHVGVEGADADAQEEASACPDDGGDDGDSAALLDQRPLAAGSPLHVVAAALTAHADVRLLTLHVRGRGLVSSLPADLAAAFGRIARFPLQPA